MWSLKFMNCVALLSLATAAPAIAQQEMNIRKQGVRPYSTEIKPVTTALSAIPGIGGIGIGTEAFLTPKVSWFVDGTYMDVNLPGTTLKRAREAADDEPFPVHTYGYNVTTGARWYSSPATSSWYAGLGLGYAETNGKWESNDERVKVKTASTLPSVAAGYRILWSNNLLMRIGGGVASNVNRTKDVVADGNTQAAKDAENKIDDRIDRNLVANVDFGFGYAW